MATKQKSTKPAAEPKEKKEHAAVPQATQDAAAHCIKNGYHNKLRLVVKGLPDDHPFKIEAMKKAQSMDAEAKAKAKAEAKKRAKTAIKPEQILDKYDELHDLLAEYELQEKLVKKPFRHAVVARRRIKVFRDNFKRNCG